MYSKDAEEVIADLDEFLKSRHPSSVFQFITGMMIGWTHFDKNTQPSVSKINSAWSDYFKLLRKSIDNRLSRISSQSYSNVRPKALRIPRYVHEKRKLNEIINILGLMPPDDGLNFIVEVTTNWCFSLPINFLPLFSDAPSDESDEAIANAIYTWLVRYYDLWP